MRHGRTFKAEIFNIQYSIFKLIAICFRKIVERTQFHSTKNVDNNRPFVSLAPFRVTPTLCDSPNRTSNITHFEKNGISVRHYIEAKFCLAS